MTKIIPQEAASLVRPSKKEILIYGRSQESSKDLDLIKEEFLHLMAESDNFSKRILQHLHLHKDRVFLSDGKKKKEVVLQKTNKADEKLGLGIHVAYYHFSEKGFYDEALSDRGFRHQIRKLFSNNGVPFLRLKKNKLESGIYIANGEFENTIEAMGGNQEGKEKQFVNNEYEALNALYKGNAERYHRPAVWSVQKNLFKKSGSFAELIGNLTETATENIENLKTDIAEKIDFSEISDPKKEKETLEQTLKLAIAERGDSLVNQTIQKVRKMILKPQVEIKMMKNYSEHSFSKQHKEQADQIHEAANNPDAIPLMNNNLSLLSHHDIEGRKRKASYTKDIDSFGKHIKHIYTKALAG